MGAHEVVCDGTPYKYSKLRANHTNNKQNRKAGGAAAGAAAGAAGAAGATGEASPLTLVRARIPTAVWVRMAEVVIDSFTDQYKVSDREREREGSGCE